MDSLANYGSDDDYEDSQEEKKSECRYERAPVPSSLEKITPRRATTSDDSQADVNYEEVQMDLSEESDESSERKPSSKSSSSRRSRDRDDQKSRHDYERERRNSPKYKDDYRGRKYRDDDRNNRSKEERSNHGREDRNRHYERDRYRSDSRRDRREKSRSPRRQEHRGKRSRSRSREREPKTSGFSKRYDRATNKMAQLEKLGIEIKTPDCKFVTPSELQRSMEDQKQNKNEVEKDRFFMPGITGRFKDQIEKRKLLWQKKDPVKPETREIDNSSSSSNAEKLWEGTTFAQDSDGKVANKFKRLMGIRNPADGSNSMDGLKKQEEMFSSMEQQYEVARTATHTMRGVGLGFGNFQR